MIARGEELPPGERESEIRAGAIVACEQIVRASNGRLSTLELDWYLWRVGTSRRSTCEVPAVSSLTYDVLRLVAMFRQGAALPRHRTARDARHVLLLSGVGRVKNNERRYNRGRVHPRFELSPLASPTYTRQATARPPTDDDNAPIPPRQSARNVRAHQAPPS